jgi:hypothetical protein
MPTWQRHLHSLTNKAIVLALLAYALFPAMAASAASPDFGPGVLIFDPSMPAAAIQKAIDGVYAVQQHNEFGPQRNALLFLPGNYHVDVPVGYYTEVMGLGASPDDTRIAGNVHADASLPNNNATTTFWRAAEGFSVTPTGGNMQWAVSQAVPLRRMHIAGNLVLHQDHGWASGGWMSDDLVDGNVDSGTQQQWISRNCEWRTWTGSNWNMVFVGVVHPPAGKWPSPPYTEVPVTPIVREKPFLQVNKAGEFSVRVPSLRANSTGITWQGGETPGRSIPISEFYIARAGVDTADSINAQLARGRESALHARYLRPRLSHSRYPPNTVVLGLGFATLRPIHGTAAMTTADADGIILPVCCSTRDRFNRRCCCRSDRMEAGPAIVRTRSLSRCLFPGRGRRRLAARWSTLEINSNDTIVDHTWIWRADHGSGVGWNLNTSANGMVVNGDRA